jgi:hypothetical protein
MMVRTGESTMTSPARSRRGASSRTVSGESSLSHSPVGELGPILLGFPTPIVQDRKPAADAGDDAQSENPPIFGNGYRDTLNCSRFVPTACPHERETGRTTENQHGPSGGRDGDVYLGFHGFCAVNCECPNPCNSDLKSVRSPDRRRSRPPENAPGQRNSEATRWTASISVQDPSIKNEPRPDLEPASRPGSG